MSTTTAIRTPDSDSVTQWLVRLKSRDHEAFRRLCERYLPTLVGQVRRQTRSQNDLDQHEIANSVLHSLWVAMAERQRLSDVNDREGLLRILCGIVRQKLRRRHRNATRLKRDESTTVADTFATVPCDQPTPEELVQMNDTVESWLGMLDPTQSHIARLKLAGYTNSEIARQSHHCSVRSVERQLHTIRLVWIKRLADEGLSDEVSEERGGPECGTGSQ
jgi:RNA polymerase sigma factor (sigma-70 family)